GERRVECRDIVALGQQEVVAARIVERVLVHREHPRGEVDEEVGAGERRPDEAPASGRHPEAALADAEGELLFPLEAAHTGRLVRVCEGWIVRSSPRWWRYQFTPRCRRLSEATSGCASRKARISGRRKTGRSRRHSPSKTAVTKARSSG